MNGALVDGCQFYELNINCGVNINVEWCGYFSQSGGSSPSEGCQPEAGRERGNYTQPVVRWKDDLAGIRLCI